MNYYQIKFKLPKKLSDQGGAVPLLLLLAAVGLMAFLLISNTFNFKDRLFNTLFPKPPSSAKEQTNKPDSVADELLVKFKPGVDEKTKTNIHKLYGLTKKSSIDKLGVDVLKVNPHSKDKVIEALKNSDLVEYAEPNYLLKPDLIPNDLAWSTAEGNLIKINAPTAWDITIGTSSVIVADLDTGFKTDHEDLVGKLLLPGYNIADNNTDLTDTDGHGTSTAGVIGAATNNAKGVASLGFNISILPIKITNVPDGSATISNVASAFIYAADHGAKAINLSYGAGASSNTELDAENYAWNKGAVIAAAGGNSAGSPVEYPGADPLVIAVGGSSSNDTHYWNSGSGLKVIAPAAGIYTTCIGSTGCYGAATGTSFATPQVAALAGLIFSIHPNFTPKQVVDVIESTADDLYTSGWDPYTGFGRINAARALQRATGTTGPIPDTTSPQIQSVTPAYDAVVSGTVNVSANVIDNVGVTKVTFSSSCKDKNGNATSGGPAASLTTSPYSFVWDSTKVPDGTCSLRINPYDAAGNVGNIQIFNNLVYFKVKNTTTSDTTAPTVSLDSIGRDGYGRTTFNTTATDDVGISEVSFYVDGIYVDLTNNTTYPPGTTAYTGYWNDSDFPNGTYTIQAKAYDTSYNVTSSNTLIVTINHADPPPTPSSATPIAPPPDTTAPIVSITSPTNGSTVSGNTTVNLSDSDDRVVAKIEVYLDNNLFCSGINPSSQYSCYWKTYNTPNGTHTLVAKAIDGAGNVGTSSSITVTVNNNITDTTPPTVSVTSPTSGATVTGTTTLSANASDNVGVYKVTFLVDGGYVGEAITSSTSCRITGSNSFNCSINWDSSTVANGTHTIVANAQDTKGNVGSSTLVSFNTNNTTLTTPPPTPTPIPTPTPTPLPTPIPADIIVPTVTITSPLNGATVTKGSTVTIQATATDNVGVNKVDFYVNGVLVSGCSDTTSPYSCNWKVPKAGGKNSTYTIKATAIDSSNNSSSNSISVTSK